MQGRVDEMGLLVVCSYWLLIWAYICSMYQQKVQHQIETLSLSRGRGGTIIHGYSRGQFINLRPSFNMRLLKEARSSQVNVIPFSKYFFFGESLPYICYNSHIKS